MLKSLLKKANTLMQNGVDNANSLLQTALHKEVKIAITGLSRSGKSMLFTSLLTLMRDRAAQNNIDYLPLLTQLPIHRIKTVEIRPIEGEKMYPLEESQAHLAQGKWPQPTQEVYGFELFIALHQEREWLKHLNDTQTLSFKFYDYPGEWLTDLPMLKLDYLAWSHKALAQQSSNPQKQYATQWHRYLESFNFDTLPTASVINEMIAVYKNYLIETKRAGITVLQPANMLLAVSQHDWSQYGFAPLPTDVTSDPSHPWVQIFTKHYQHYQTHALKPLHERYFANTDKQIILVDLFEGLSYGQRHLKQLKETITNLASIFVYGKTNWFKSKFFNEHKISDIAFVASKVDSAPLSQQANLLSLLEDVSKGARSVLEDQPVRFEHFLLAAIKSAENDPKNEKDCIYYRNERGQTVKKSFTHPIPDKIQGIREDQGFIPLNNIPREHYLDDIQQAQGIDSLLNFMLEEK
jgi:uncharacterized protein